MHDALVEGIVVGDDDLMERYLGDETIDIAELEHALADGVASGDGVPGPVRQRDQAHRHRPARATFIVEEGPAPHADGGRRSDRVAFVFKTIVDPYVGHVNLFKVLQGTVKHRRHAGQRPHRCTDERLHQLFVDARQGAGAGRPRSPAGDIAAVAKLADTTTGDVLGAEGHDRSTVEPFAAARAACSRSRSTPSRKGDEDKLANALHRLQDEDPALAHRAQRRDPPDPAAGHGRDPPGDRARAAARASSASRSRPRTCRSPTARRSPAQAEAEGKYKKQTGGHGQFGGRVRCASSRSSAAAASSSSTRSSAAPSPASSSPRWRRASTRPMEHGGVLGFPVVDVKVTCFDGKYHSGRLAPR